jgi:hypothetical protein
LDAVAQAELGQDPADVNFHRALGHEQASASWWTCPPYRSARGHLSPDHTSPVGLGPKA